MELENNNVVEISIDELYESYENKEFQQRLENGDIKLCTEKTSEDITGKAVEILNYLYKQKANNKSVISPEHRRRINEGKEEKKMETLKLVIDKILPIVEEEKITTLTYLAKRLNQSQILSPKRQASWNLTTLRYYLNNARKEGLLPDDFMNKPDYSQNLSI